MTDQKARITGIWTALITPFKKDGRVDEKAFRKLVRRQIDAGVAGIVPVGTTGESPTLSKDEQKELIKIAVKEAKGSSTRVMAGTGSNNTETTIKMSHWAYEHGVDAVLVVVPYYNKPSQKGLFAHFQAVANSVECPVCLYNVPGRTVIGLELETIVALAKNPKISCIKEATGDPEFTRKIREAIPKEELSILSGDDGTFFQSMENGAEGCVSVASNLVPASSQKIVDEFLSGNVDTAKTLNNRFQPIYDNEAIEANPTPIKFWMSELGLCENTFRLPLVSVTDENKTKLKEILKQCEITDGL